MPASRFSIEAVFKAIDKVTAPVTRIGNTVGKVTRRINTSLGTMNSRLKRVGKTAGSALGVIGVAGALLAVKMAMGAVIMTGAEFEQTLVGAGARFSEPIKKGTEAFRELEKVARITGATTEFTANQAAGGLNFLAKAGFTAQQSMALLPGLVDLATASELDLARASDIASDAIGAFGQMTDDTAELQIRFTRISDQMAKTVNSANVDMEQLFETIRKGAPAATAAGVPMETFLGLTAQLANAGLKASDAGTALKNIFLKLADVGVQQKLKKLGVSVKNIDTGELRDFADIMDDLAESTKDRSGIERAGIINELFGLRGVTGVATILSTGTDGLREFRKELTGSEGETQRLAATMRDTLTGEMKTLSSAVESLSLTFFAANSGGVSSLVTGLTDLVRAIDGFAAANPIVSKMIVGFLALSVAALAVGLVIAGIAAAVSFVTGSVAALIITGGVLGAMFLKWLDPINSAVRGLEILRDTFPSVDSAFNFLGFNGDDADNAPNERRGPISPADRVAGAIEEKRQTSTAELTIRDGTGRAELERKGSSPGIKLDLVESGAF